MALVSSGDKRDIGTCHGNLSEDRELEAVGGLESWDMLTCNEKRTPDT